MLRPKTLTSPFSCLSLIQKAKEQAMEVNGKKSLASPVWLGAFSAGLKWGKSSRTHNQADSVRKRHVPVSILGLQTTGHDHEGCAGACGVSMERARLSLSNTIPHTLAPHSWASPGSLMVPATERAKRPFGSIHTSRLTLLNRPEAWSSGGGDPAVQQPSPSPCHFRFRHSLQSQPDPAVRQTGSPGTDGKTSLQAADGPSEERAKRPFGCINALLVLLLLLRFSNNINDVLSFMNFVLIHWYLKVLSVLENTHGNNLHLFPSNYSQASMDKCLGPYLICGS